MTRRQKIKNPKKTGHPYIDNALRNTFRGFQVELNTRTAAPWVYFHVGLPRKRKKNMKKISMRMNIIHYIAGISKESK